jgi:hypothetical protein
VKNHPETQELFPPQRRLDAIRYLEALVPHSERPALCVLGNYDHFIRSVLGKIGRKRFDLYSLETADNLRNLPGPTAFIKWSPWSLYDISLADRARVPEGVHIINDTHFKCAKDNVQKAFFSVFGYQSSADCKASSGFAVLKSLKNAAHDGRIVSLPIQQHTLNADSVLEKLIDNSFAEVVCDIRLPFILGEIPLAYLKFRPVEQRFSNKNIWAAVVAPEDILSTLEIEQCRQFCHAIGLEYGEIDVLRDGASHKIYIVDANNTPYGPPNGLDSSVSDVALRLISAAVTRCFFVSDLARTSYGDTTK